MTSRSRSRSKLSEESRNGQQNQPQDNYHNAVQVHTPKTSKLLVVTRYSRLEWRAEQTLVSALRSYVAIRREYIDMYRYHAPKNAGMRGRRRDHFVSDIASRRNDDSPWWRQKTHSHILVFIPTSDRWKKVRLKSRHDLHKASRPTCSYHRAAATSPQRQSRQILELGLLCDDQRHTPDNFADCISHQPINSHCTSPHKNESSLLLENNELSFKFEHAAIHCVRRCYFTNTTLQTQ